MSEERQAEDTPAETPVSRKALVMAALLVVAAAVVGYQAGFMFGHLIDNPPPIEVPPLRPHDPVLPRHLPTNLEVQ